MMDQTDVTFRTTADGKWWACGCGRLAEDFRDADGRLTPICGACKRLWQKITWRRSLRTCR
jgi:hypothetical protein